MKTHFLLTGLLGLFLTDVKADDEKLENLVSKEEAAAIAAEATKASKSKKAEKSDDTEVTAPIGDKPADSSYDKSSKSEGEEANESEEAEEAEEEKEEGITYRRSYRQFKDYSPSNQITDRPSVRTLGNTNEQSRPLK